MRMTGLRLLPPHRSSLSKYIKTQLRSPAQFAYHCTGVPHATRSIFATRNSPLMAYWLCEVASPKERQALAEIISDVTSFTVEQRLNDLSWNWLQSKENAMVLRMSRYRKATAHATDPTQETQANTSTVERGRAIMGFGRVKVGRAAMTSAAGRVYDNVAKAVPFAKDVNVRCQALLRNSSSKGRDRSFNKIVRSRSRRRS
eukprot:7314580-Prymnesium_polylepis.1